MIRAEPPRTREVAAVLAVSALAGFVMGLLRPAPHVAVEPAQMLSGIVRYPEGNPFGLYQASVWTIWHQVLAPLLAAGVSERALNFALSGLIGALGFAAIGLFSLVFGAAPWLACCTPFFVAVADPNNWGFHYPILLLGQGHTYGAAGLAWLLLVLGLLGTGNWRAGAFALGFAPALHASLGAWLALAVGSCALLSWREVFRYWREILTGGTLGVLIASASLALHLVQVPEARIDPAEATRYLDTFLRLWDSHRVPPALVSWQGGTVLCAIGIALALLTQQRDQLPPAARFALRCLTVCASVGLGLGALEQLIPLDSFPGTVKIAMPTRFLNLPMLAFVPLAAGALWRRRADPLARIALLVLPVGALAAAWKPSISSVELPVLGVAVLLAILRPRPVDIGRGTRRFVDVAIALACLAVVTLGFAEGVRDLPTRLYYFIDSSNNAVLRAASRSTGLLAVGSGVECAQLRTRRPLLLDPAALDMLPYAPAGGPAMAHILERVYGVDFFRPPLDAIHKASLPAKQMRRLWEARMPWEWEALGQEFGFSEVLVVQSWRLRLPEVSRDYHLALYRVPTRPGAAHAGPAEPAKSRPGAAWPSH